MTTSTTTMLEEYLVSTEDTQGVLHMLRTYYSGSMPTYINSIRRHWLDRNTPGPDYENDMCALIEEFKDEPLVVQRLGVFHRMTVVEKYKILRTLKSRPFSGSLACDAQLSKVRLLPQMVEDLKLSSEERVSYSKRSEDALRCKGSTVFTVNVAELLETCHAMLSDPETNAFDLAVALGCVTGRRMIELFKCGDFEPVDGAPYEALFRGQAKKASADSTAFTIPLLDSFDAVFDAVQKLRRQKPCEELSNIEINLKYSTSCNKAARRILGDDRHFHDCRGIYAVTIYHSTMPHEHSLNSVVSRVLGHSSLQQSLNYACLQIENVHEDLKHPFDFA